MKIEKEYEFQKLMKLILELQNIAIHRGFDYKSSKLLQCFEQYKETYDVDENNLIISKLELIREKIISKNSLTDEIYTLTDEIKTGIETTYG